MWRNQYPYALHVGNVSKVPWKTPWWLLKKSKTRNYCLVSNLLLGYTAELKAGSNISVASTSQQQHA